MKYISLFSSAGIGTFGLRQNGHVCIATNELLAERMKFQIMNDICSDDEAYIQGDITKEETKKKIFRQIKKHGNPDIVIATPPCQGISLLNLKKNDNDKFRNSLVVESFEIISKTTPKLFILENVSRFLQTACLHNANWKSIKQAIIDELSGNYSIAFKVINLKHVGANSSRTRTIVIGLRKDISKHYSPWELFPNKVLKIPTLFDVIGDLKSLEWGEIDKNDFYHAFRTYDRRMKLWIEGIEPGQSAFDNLDPTRRPHKVKDGIIIENKNSTGDKYKRQFPDKVAACVMTRNDQLASQNTIHPFDDRVFSIRELMRMMTIPETFKFFDISNSDFNKLSLDHKQKMYKANELNIRRTIGESVPTFLFKEIVEKFTHNESKKKISTPVEIKRFIEDNNLKNPIDLVPYTESLSRISLNLLFEELESSAKETGLYFTNPDVVTELINDLEFSEKKIIEPSVGLGSFLIPLIHALADKEVEYTCFDINSNAIKILEKLIGNRRFVRFMNEDFLSHTHIEADLIIGNPPYVQIKNGGIYKINSDARNLFELFVYKSLEISKSVQFVLPKYVLFNSKYATFRNYVLNKGVKRFWDHKGMLFPNAKIETVVISFSNKKTNTFISDGEMFSIDLLTNKFSSIWTIHPNKELIKYGDSLLRDPKIKATRMLKYQPGMSKDGGDIKVYRSSNLRGETNFEFVDKNDFIQEQKMTGLFVPNMTPNIRAIKKPKNSIWNGSLALVQVSEEFEKSALKTWNTKKFRDYISMMRSHAQRSINIDKEIIKHFGVENE